MLRYHRDLCNQKTDSDFVDNTEIAPKPDNSEEKCNLVVKKIKAGTTEKELEIFFTSKYGPVQNCKVAKDEEGRPKTYGFVWFKEGKHANAAMLDFKSGKCPYTLDWYKILAQRQSQKIVDTKEVRQILVTWRRIDQNSFSQTKIQKKDLLTYFEKFGQIVDSSIQSEHLRALIAFSSSQSADFALIHPKFTFREHTV